MANHRPSRRLRYSVSALIAPVILLLLFITLISPVHAEHSSYKRSHARRSLEVANQYARRTSTFGKKLTTDELLGERGEYPVVVLSLVLTVFFFTSLASLLA